jgi:hypothetical protein
LQVPANKEVQIEFPPVAVFFALNEKVKPRDRVGVIAYRNCLAPHQLRGQWVQTAGGDVVYRPAGRMQSTVEKCVQR